MLPQKSQIANDIRNSNPLLLCHVVTSCDAMIGWWHVVHGYKLQLCKLDVFWCLEQLPNLRGWSKKSQMSDLPKEQPVRQIKKPLNKQEVRLAGERKTPRVCWLLDFSHWLQNICNQKSNIMGFMNYREKFSAVLLSWWHKKILHVCPLVKAAAAVWKPADLDENLSMENTQLKAINKVNI